MNGWIGTKQILVQSCIAIGWLLKKKTKPENTKWFVRMQSKSELLCPVDGCSHYGKQDVGSLKN